jgi:hypothetical protein
MTKTKTVARVSVLGVAALAIGLMACSSEPQFPETPDAGAPAPTPTPTPTPTTPPPPQVVDCDAGQQAQITAAFAGRVGTEAPKMSPEGPLVCGVLQEGATVSGPVVTLQPGMCYTALGNGLPSVQDVDIAVVIDASAAAAIPGLGPLAATLNAPLMVDNIQNAMTGANIKAEGCFKLQPPFVFPVPVHVTGKAHTGSGPVGVQLYSRKL